jgi:hypothetical protein
MIFKIWRAFQGEAAERGLEAPPIQPGKIVFKMKTEIDAGASIVSADTDASITACF